MWFWQLAFVSIVQLAVKDLLEAAGDELPNSTCQELVHAYSMLGDMAAAHQALKLLSTNNKTASREQGMAFGALLEWYAFTSSSTCIDLSC